MSISIQDCARCHRPVPDQVSDEFLSWEALDETGEQLICPRCLTPSQERAVAGDGHATGETAAGIAPSHDGDLRDKVAADLRDKVAADLRDKMAAELSDKVAAEVSAILSDTVAVELSDTVAGEVSDTVAGLEELGGMSASRFKAIAGGEEPNNGELEELGYIFVQLMRSLKE
jgi:hypothetical protein